MASLAAIGLSLLALEVVADDATFDPAPALGVPMSR